MSKEWKLVKLGDYISIKSGLAYQGSKIGTGDSYLLGMGCVSFKDKFVDSGARLYDGSNVDSSYCVFPGDIVLATRQQSDNLPILAMPAIIPDTFSNKKVIYGTNLYKVDNNSCISNRFLFWLLKHQHYVNYIAGVKSGTAVQMVTKKNVENYKFFCPPQGSREKIADILWSYDELIENNNKRIAILEQMAENLYKEWFIRFRFPGYEAVNFEEKKPFGWIVSSCENTKIPSCFDFCEFSELGSFTRGRNITAAEMVEGEIPVISAGLQPSGYHNKANVTGRSLTISASGANAGYLQYNLSDIWAADCSYYQNEKNLWFVYCTLKFLQPVISNLQCGAAQPHVYPKNINKLCVLKPTNELIVKLNQTVEPFFDEIETLKKKNQNLIKQRDLLLPRLMSGKLEV